VLLFQNAQLCPLYILKGLLSTLVNFIDGGLMGSKHSSPSPFGSILNCFSGLDFGGDLEGNLSGEGLGSSFGGDFLGEPEELWAGVSSKDVLGVAFVGVDAVSVVSVGPRAGESAARVDAMLV
jgi:hypothetical protein